MYGKDAIQSLRLDALTKRFPGVLACNKVSLELEASQILALVGENGAGKTTLMNILMGLYQPDEGRILINGQEQKFRTPLDAHACGIGMVHQHFMLVPNLTVCENIMLGLRSKHRFWKLNEKGVKDKIMEVSEHYGLPVHPDAYIWQLSVGEQQRVELVKTLCLGARLLILDEPTSALTPQETDDLIELLLRVKEELSIIFISHKLNEVMALADKVAVLRHGEVVYKGNIAEQSPQSLAALMTGHEVQLPRNEIDESAKETLLDIRALSLKGDRGHQALKDFTLDLKKGEILGLAGVSGNGQKELADVLAGLRPVDSGEIVLEDFPIQGKNPRAIIEAGMGYIPEDRHNEGIVPVFSIKENLVLKDFATSDFSRAGFLRLKEIENNAHELKERFDIRTAHVGISAGTLSGGNIQKVILARELVRKPKALVAVYPTRGLDLGAIEFIHKRLLELKKQGVGILLISEELDELMNLSDRIAVIYKGSIVKVLPAAQANRRRLGALMAGIQEEAEVLV